MLDRNTVALLKKEICRIRDEVLNDRQNEAVDAILTDWKIKNGFVFPIIDGPPGTGKTKVGSVAATEYHLNHPKRQILYMCYTNQACAMAQDSITNILKGCVPTQASAANVPGSDAGLVLRLEYGGETEWEKGVVGRGQEAMSDEEVRRLWSAPILICTLYSSSTGISYRSKGCKLILDEFSQIDPTLFFDVVYRVRSGGKEPSGFALLGDPLQLPVVTSQPHLETNIEKYIEDLKKIAPITLNVQYRMHDKICAGINSIRTALGSRQPLTSDKTVKKRDMTEWYGWKESKAGKYRRVLDPSYPFVIVNTDSLSGGVPGSEEQAGVSWKNVSEAKLAADIFATACAACKRIAPGAPEFQILTPYGGQVQEIRAQLRKRLGAEFEKKMCTTIHSSQGNEYDFVIVSFVRSNPRGALGFLEDDKLASQAYVACSRAKGKLIVLFSEKTFLVGGHKVFDALYNTREAIREDAP